MTIETTQITPRELLEELTINYMRQAKADLTVAEKASALEGNVRNIGKLPAAFKQSEEGNTAMGVSMRTLFAVVNHQGKAFMGVRNAIREIQAGLTAPALEA